MAVTPSVPRKDLSVWVGNDWAQSFKFWADADKTTAFDFTGSEIIFRATWDGGEFRRTSADGGVVIDDPETGEIAVSMTPADTRKLPEGQKARYEIERRIGGKEKTLLSGYLVATNWGGNDDE